jgi:mono/diheme cytochrome c family protein
MNRQRLVLLVVAAIALAGIVSACGSSSSSSSSSQSSSSQASSSTASTSTTSASATTSSTTTSTTSTSTTAPSGGSAAAGKTVFTSTCGSCHTLAAAGTHGAVGPNLDTAKPSEGCVVQQVTHGGAVKPPCPAATGSIMPAFAQTLSTTQIQSVAKYVASVAGKT